MKLIAKNILLALLTLFVISVLFSFLISQESSKKVLGIDELVMKINAGEVSKIIVRGEDLEVELKDQTVAYSRKEAEAGLSETLRNYGVESNALQNIAFEIQGESGLRFWAGLLIPSLLPILIIGAILWIMMRQAKSGMGQAFTFGKANVRLFNQFKDKVTFKDVAGLKEAKNELWEVVDFLKYPKKFLEIGSRIPRGVLLIGAPGTGKTLLARAAAGEANVPFFYISGSEFVEMFVGVGASRVRDLFSIAKKAAPAIVFIDEIDAVGRERGTGLGGGNDEREQTLNQILVEMDGFERDTNIIVVAATNRPDILDSALLRPGRFDRRVILDLPDAHDREEILKIHAREKKLAPQINFQKIAVRTPGFSGADLANLMNEAAIFAARKNQKIIHEQDVLNSIEKVLLGPERKARVVTKKEKEITAYHEAGHALVAASLKESDPVHKISIISRGMAGGYTLKLPEQEERLRTRAQFLADIAVALGGYVSEKIVFGDITTGASNDLKMASEISYGLVTKYGMSEKLGPISFGGGDGVSGGRELIVGKKYSEKIAAKIDEEVNTLIQNAYKTAQKIVKTRRKVLDAIAKSLTEKEVLEQEEFNGILKGFNIKPIAISYFKA